MPLSDPPVNGALMSHADFRVRKVPSGYRIWQRVGRAWEALADVYATRADAKTAIRKLVTP